MKKMDKRRNIVPALCAAALLMGFSLSACAQPGTAQGNNPLPQTGTTPTNGRLLFNSGFEPDSKVVPVRPGSSDDDIVGVDHSVAPPNDWVADLDKSGKLGNFNLQYEGGDTTQRFARIIAEPGNPGNRVLHFWASQPNVSRYGKTRIQANIYASEAPGQTVPGIRELYQSVRMYLPADMEEVKTYPDKISWLTIMEVWNNITWRLDVPYGFRITVGMGKPDSAARELYFMVDAEDCLLDGTINPQGEPRQKYVTIWKEMNQQMPIPVGKWLTLEYYIKEGNAGTGRFYMAVTPEGGEKRVIFDIHNFTHGTGDPAPDGIKHWNPMKLYTSKALTEHMMAQGKALQIYWDDFSIWEGRRP